MLRSLFVTLGGALLLASSAGAANITLDASKDNTLYENGSGNISNGVGAGIIAGRTNEISNFLRRAVVAFDVAGSIPAGSNINSASLQLTLTQTVSAAHTVEIRRLTANWGEGTSNAISLGQGTTAQTNDATWTNAFFPSTNWTTAGGDFSATVTATQSVNSIAAYTWTSAQLTADVQAMLDTPANNFGWIVIGNEAAAQSAKAFASREHGTPASRPKLIIDYTAPSSVYDWTLY